MKSFWFIFLRRLFAYLSAFLLGLFSILTGLSGEVKASSEAPFQNNSRVQIVELISLDVPSESKEAWLNAEKGSWAPWLEKQRGFLGRKLFWDPRKEEAMLLISWQSRAKWKSIKQSELDVVQELFEKLAREGTGQKTGNPFPIRYEGELLPQ